MQKIKAFFQSKSARLTMMVCSLAAFMCCSALAVGEPVTPPTAATVTAAFASGFTTMASDALTMIATIVPIALGVAGVIFLAKKAMGWFKSLAK